MENFEASSKIMATGITKSRDNIKSAKLGELEEEAPLFIVANP